MSALKLPDEIKHTRLRVCFISSGSWYRYYFINLSQHNDPKVYNILLTTRYLSDKVSTNNQLTSNEAAELLPCKLLTYLHFFHAKEAFSVFISVGMERLLNQSVTSKISKNRPQMEIFVY
jgi:hypothetical protein